MFTISPFNPNVKILKETNLVKLIVKAFVKKMT